MPALSRSLVVISPDSLFGALLAAFAQNQCGLSLRARYHTVDAAAASPVGAGIVLCDLRLATDSEMSNALARLAKSFPDATLVPIGGRPNAQGRLHAASGIEDLLAALESPAQDGLEGDGLTRLESEVLIAVASGRRNADIARVMRRSSKTVEKHRANAMRKLGLRNAAEVTAWCIGARLLEPASVLGTRTRCVDFRIRRSEP